MIVVVFTLLKIYVLVFETNFQDLNVKNINEIQNNLKSRTQFSFAVVGNVENSIDVFDKKILPLINNDDFDFIIFAGDFLLDGGKDKYGAFYKTAKKLKVPVIIVVGDNEVSDFGAKRFYKHFGPYYFSFNVADSNFIFLDTTGETSEEWQKEWLINELENTKKYKNKFVITNRPLEKQSGISLALSDSEYKFSEDYINFLKKTFSDYNITAVFSSDNEDSSNITKLNGVDYLSTGGGGGLLLTMNRPDYNFIKTIVTPQKTSHGLIKLDEGSASTFAKLWKKFWFRLHSWFYISYINFILISAILFFLIYLIYSKLIETPDLYPKYNLRNNTKKRLTIAMFTNNYLPFIGGVPISIARLQKALEEQGHNVYIFAPKYPNDSYEKNVIRCKPLFYYKKGKLIVPITNIFSTKTRKEFLKIKPDIVHIHHPYWLGSIGLKLAKKNNVPIVYTYHTRIEQYNHYIPLLFRKLAGGRIPHMLIKKFANSCDAIIAPTKSAKEYLRNLGVGKIIKVLPTGVDINAFEANDKITSKISLLKEKFAFARDNEIILFSVFRLSKEKNPYFLLKGIKQIKEKTNIKFKCLIAGTGPEEDNMKKFIEKNILSNTVYMLGKIKPEDIPLYYLLADIFIFSSKSETQGMVLLEAMAGSCPVVAIKSSGIENMIIDNENGFKAKDNLSEWCDKIMYLMKNKDVLKEMSKQAHEFSKNYSVETIAKKTLNLYFQIISEK